MATAIVSGRMKTLTILSIVFVQCISPVSAKWVKSSIDTRNDWAFLTRFCFLSEDGGFRYTFKYPKSYGVEELLLYYDAPGQWESVYKSDKNCTARLSVLSKANNQIIELTNNPSPLSRLAGCSVYNQSGKEYYNCADRVRFRASRERWWYIALARCGPSAGGEVGLKLEYEIHMTNGEPGDFLHYELSADEFYILPVDISFLVVFFILLLLSLVCAVKLFDRSMLHTTYKMYITSLSLWTFGLLLQCIAWGRYSATGWEEGPTEVTGRLFQAASTTVFLLMLILMAKGFTITRGRLTKMSSVRLTIFFCLYVTVNVVLFIWEGAFFDEGYVLYFYESPPGYGLIAMRLIGWLWFLYAFCFTMKHHSEKAKFYIPFFIFYTIWFWAGPVIILIAIFSMAKWSRQKTVNGVEQFVALCGQLFFLMLTRPSAANKNFPYHLRVSQVRFIDDEDSEPANTYELSEESRQHLDNIFVVQRGRPSATTFDGPANGNHFNGYPKRDGEINNGFMKSENGYNPALENIFTTQRTGQLPPLTATAPLPSVHNGPLLPPLHDQQGSSPMPDNDAEPVRHKHRKLAQQQDQDGQRDIPRDEGEPQAPYTDEDKEQNSVTDNGMQPLPPLQAGRSQLPPLQSDLSQLLPLQPTGSQLPPLKSEGSQLPALQSERPQLPPLRSGALPPI